MRNNRSTIEDRRQQILRMVKKNGQIRVEEIAERFHISLMTARRDLKLLKQEGLLSRVHGGAVSMEKAHQMISPDEWIAYCRDCISRYAARFAGDGETLFINGSRTALHLLHYTGDKRLMVYTNNCWAMEEAFPEGVSVRYTGGEVRNHVMVGEYVMRNLLSLEADNSFIGCAAVYEDGEFRYDIPTEIGINELLMSRTKKKVYILADHSKLRRRDEKNNIYGSCSYDSPVTLITDDNADRQIVEKLESAGIEVLIVPTN